MGTRRVRSRARARSAGSTTSDPASRREARSARARRTRRPADTPAQHAQQILIRQQSRRHDETHQNRRLPDEVANQRRSARRRARVDRGPAIRRLLMRLHGLRLTQRVVTIHAPGDASIRNQHLGHPKFKAEHSQSDIRADQLIDRGGHSMAEGNFTASLVPTPPLTVNQFYRQSRSDAGQRWCLSVGRRIACADRGHGTVAGAVVPHPQRSAVAVAGESVVDGVGRLVARRAVRVPARVRSDGCRVSRHLQPEPWQCDARAARTVAGRQRRRADHVRLLHAGDARARSVSAPPLRVRAREHVVADRDRAEHPLRVRPLHRRHEPRAGGHVFVQPGIARADHRRRIRASRPRRPSSSPIRQAPAASAVPT